MSSRPSRGLTHLEGRATIRLVAKDDQRGKAPGPARPTLTPAAEAAFRARKARLAEALRANLRRRKADLAHRAGAATAASRDDHSPADNDEER